MTIVLGCRKSRPTAKALALALGAHYSEHGFDEEGLCIRYGNSHINDPEDGNILNTQLSVQTASNKPETKRILYEKHVNTPRLISWEDALSGNVEWPIIVRRNSHFKGKFFYICNNVAEVRRYNPSRHYIQEMVDKIDEFRLFVLRDKIIEANIKKCPSPDIMIRNKENGCFFGRVRVSELPRDLRNAARNGIREVGLDFGAVDIATINRNGRIECSVFEINSAPGLITRKIELLRDKLQEMELL